MHVLEWLRANSFPWDASCCAAAAHANDLATLQWLRLRGCPWDKATTSRAAVEGHGALLDWCRQQGCDYSEETILRMKIRKMQLAMSSDHVLHDRQTVRVGERGVLMVTRHPRYGV